MRDSAQIARVISVGRNAAWIAYEGVAEPLVASLKKNDAMRGMLVPGDLVDVREIEPGRVVVERVHPRAFTLERRSYRGRRTVMAANVDTVVITAALVEPPIRLALVDQLIVFAELNELRAILVLTKVDLGAPEEASAILNLYHALGYTALAANPKAGTGIDAFSEAIVDRHALLVGNSGVGKSSLFRALGGSGAVGEVSARLGRGRQTTTTARLFRLGAGFLIDSPGVGAFELGAIEASELTYGFVEMREPSRHCRFTDCTHQTEPDCAVRAGVEAGTIAASRYASYREILTRARS